MKIREFKNILDKDTKHNKIIQEREFNYNSDTKFSHPSIIANMMNDLFKLNKLAEEHVYMITFDVKSNVLGVFEISHGGANHTILGVREVLIRALLTGASRIALIHNHPSGDTTVSREDIEATRSVVNGAELVGIEVLDHIIVGDVYTSLKAEGLM